MNFCPCLQSLLSKFKDKKPRASYDGPREFEEEEFMNPHQEEVSLSDAIAPQVIIAQSIKQKSADKEKKPLKISEPLPDYEEEKESEAEVLNIKMEMPIVNAVFQPAPAEVKQEEQSIEQLIQAELLLTPSDVIKQGAIEQEAKEIPEQHHDYFAEQISFTVNLDPLDPYFSFIHEKASQIPRFLSSEGQKLEVGAPNKTGLEIIQVENPKATTFLLRYTLNCSYSFYLSVLRAEKALTGLGTLLAESKTLESYRPNLTLNTLKFRRLGALEPRDCFYVKYQNGGKRHHWELYIHNDSAPRSAEFKTCEVFCCKSFKQDGERELRVTEYVEVDLGASSLANVIPKLIAEARNFLNALNEHLESNGQEELA